MSHVRRTKVMLLVARDMSILHNGDFYTFGTTAAWIPHVLVVAAAPNLEHRTETVIDFQGLHRSVGVHELPSRFCNEDEPIRWGICQGGAFAMFTCRPSGPGTGSRWQDSSVLSWSICRSAAFFFGLFFYGFSMFFGWVFLGFSRFFYVFFLGFSKFFPMGSIAENNQQSYLGTNQTFIRLNDRQQRRTILGTNDTQQMNAHEPTRQQIDDQT